MNNFIVAAGLFLFAFLIHVAIWRLKPPRATAQALIPLLVGCIVGGAGLLAIAGALWPILGNLLPPTFSTWLHAAVTALAVACVYVMNYPALEVESPTLVMIDLFAHAGERGLSRDDLYQRLGDEFLVMPRIDDLVREGLITEIAGICQLTARGRRLKHIFSTWRRILAADVGG